MDQGIYDVDRQYLAPVAAGRAGISPEQATQRIDEVIKQAQAIEERARDVAEQARRMAMIAAFLAAASLIIGAAAAYFAVALGGNHRDNQTVVVGWYHPW